MNRTQIGDLIDHDMRLYRFERNSGLPRDYFSRRWPVSPDTIVCIVMLILGAIAAAVAL